MLKLNSSRHIQNINTTVPDCYFVNRHKVKKSVLALLCSCVLLFGLGGCSITDFSADSLLRPPKAMGDEAEIEQLISDAADGSYTLKYPKNGNYRSAIIMTDLNNDKKDEAIAFFRIADNTAQIHMLVMYTDNDKWKLSSDNVTDAPDIDSVDFADINGNGSLEILAGFTTYTQNINHLFCYSYNNGKTDEIQSGHNYSSFYSGDFDSDGNSEVMTLSLFTTENEATASMLDYSKDNKSMYARAMVNMDPNVTKYQNIAMTVIDDGTNGLVVDGSYANEEINTQIIYYNRELSLLRNPLFKEKKPNFTMRTSQVLASDIDGDDKIEIPVVAKMPYSKSQSTDTVADRITWNSFDPKSEKLVKALEVTAGVDYSFYFKIPDKWGRNSVTAVVDSKKANIKFYEWLSDKQGELLFEIKSFPLDDWEAGKETDRYTSISKNDKYAFAFKNTNADSPAALSDDEIKTGFMLSDNAAQSAN